MTDFSALGINVFAGHFTTGVLEAGATVIGAVEDGAFGVETVLQNYPEIPVWTNREEWPIQKIRELNVDLVYGNPACFPAGTMVTTINGPRPIESIRKGDLVLTGEGRYREVELTSVRFYEGDFSTVSFRYGLEELLGTSNHEVMARARVKTLVSGDRPNGGTRTWQVKGYDEPRKTALADLREGDLVCLVNVREGAPLPDTTVQYRRQGGGPTIHERPNELDLRSDAIAWALGHYVAEGSVSKRDIYCHTTTHACHVLEAPEVLSRLARAGLNPALSGPNEDNPNCRKVTVRSHDFRQLCLFFGLGAANKSLPEWVFGMPRSWQLGFLEGYFYGDGSERLKPSGGREIRASSVSKQLRDGFVRMVRQVHGVACSISERAPSTHINGRAVNGKQSYQLAFCLSSTSYRRMTESDEQGLWVSVKEVRTEAPSMALPVYNLTVTEDHTYTANGLLCNNCAGFSMASSTRGVGSAMNEGLIKAQVFGYSVLPKAFVVESVPQLFTDGIPLVEDWEEKWQALGYQTCRLSENSGHVGLAQNRKRALFIAAKANLDFSYPEHLEAATVREAISDLTGAPLERHFTYPRPPESAYQERLRRGLTEGTWNETQKMSKATASLLPYAAPGVRLRNLSDEIYEKSYWLHTRSTARGKLSFLCRRLAWDAPCSVVTGGPTYIHPDEDRFLTIREQSRMMGLPDTFTFSNPRTAYAEIGKAVSPFVGKWITEQLMGILADPDGRTHYPIVDLNARTKAIR